MALLGRLVDGTRPDSVVSRLRAKRFRFFADLMRSIPPPARVLDVGGTEHYWAMQGYCNDPRVRITVLNVIPQPTTSTNITSVVGDARQMPEFHDGEFDVVYSNSVIEHVGDFSDQRRMAQEVKRIGARYFVQTPSKYFPIEPHFFVPGFQFLPRPARAFLLSHWNLGWFKSTGDYNKALKLVSEIRLLTEKELRLLFPDASVYREHFFGLVKSLVVYGGWKRPRG